MLGGATPPDPLLPPTRRYEKRCLSAVDSATLVRIAASFEDEPNDLDDTTILQRLACAGARTYVPTMMSPEWLGAAARYNRWMNDKLYGARRHAERRGTQRDCGAFFRSIHGTFNHLLLADRVWLARFTGVTAPDGFMAPGIRALDQELYADLDDLRRERARTDDELSA